MGYFTRVELTVFCESEADAKQVASRLMNYRHEVHGGFEDVDHCGNDVVAMLLSVNLSKQDTFYVVEEALESFRVSWETTYFDGGNEGEAAHLFGGVNARKNEAHYYSSKAEHALEVLIGFTTDDLNAWGISGTLLQYFSLDTLLQNVVERLRAEGK